MRNEEENFENLSFINDWRNFDLNLVKTFETWRSINQNEEYKSYAASFPQILFSFEKNAFNRFDNLEVINMTRVDLTNKDTAMFKDLRKLKKLNLYGNKIDDIGFVSNGFLRLESLEELILKCNQVNKLDPNSFQHLSKLKKLNLAGNQMYFINANAFKGLDNLEELDLKLNRLCAVNSAVFEDLHKLKKLNLKRNRIYLINRDVFRKMEKLEVHLDFDPQVYILKFFFCYFFFTYDQK
jgi:hypothetical protein